MSGVIGNLEMDAFDREEIGQHYEDGPCGIPDCQYCFDLEQERQYWEDFEDMEARRMMEEDWGD